MRYLVVITSSSESSSKGPDESCLIGVDCQAESTTIGLVLSIWADTKITLDGDGGFSISCGCRTHIFKPTSVQAMWSSLQTLHKASDEARKGNYFEGGHSHSWTNYYDKRISSERSCLNEWNAMDGLTSRRPPSPDLLSGSSEQRATQDLIRAKLKEIMTSVDLDEVTSKYIRTRLEHELDRNLSEYKSFIDEEMLVILGQMDTATPIFDYLFLGSEWNASNLEELKMKGVEKILNVTREIDNFYPGAFDYYNVRVCDDDSTEMIKHWDKTYRYIWKAMEEGSKVLVHCKMSISRSASVVIAYVMKAKNWNLHKALQFVKNKRTCIKPNENFLKQLEVYQGILSASKQRHNSLWRSKSETNMSCSSSTSDSPTHRTRDVDSPYSPLSPCIERRARVALPDLLPGSLTRPKSWSPRATRECEFGEEPTPPQTPKRKAHRQRFGTDPSCYLIYQAREKAQNTNDHLQGQSSSSSADDTELSASPSRLPRTNSVKARVSELEGHPKRKRSSTQAVKINSRAGLVLNLANQFESANFYSNKSTPREHHHHKHHHHYHCATSRSFNYHDITNRPSSRPPIPSPRRDSKSIGIGFIGRKGTGRAQCTPEEGSSISSSTSQLPHITRQLHSSTDIAAVPQGIVREKIENFHHLKRTHSFGDKNAMARQTEVFL